MCEIAKKIYDRRKELGLTLEEVGHAVGVGRSTVQRWEKGMIKNMGRDKIAALAEVLQMNPVELVPMHKMDIDLQYFSGKIDDADQQRLEALHQNEKLRMLFDMQMNLKPQSLDAVAAIVKEIAKERGDE